jgi:hypothetical protein
MTTRHTLAALLAGTIIAVSACGGPSTRPDSAQAPTARPVAPQHVSAWQAYYDATHPAPATPRHITAWQAYYDATHPAPATPRHITAWQAYYDATHP